MCKRTHWDLHRWPHFISQSPRACGAVPMRQACKFVCRSYSWYFGKMSSRLPDVNWWNFVSKKCQRSINIRKRGLHFNVGSIWPNKKCCFGNDNAWNTVRSALLFLSCDLFSSASWYCLCLAPRLSQEKGIRLMWLNCKHICLSVMSNDRTTATCSAGSQACWNDPCCRWDGIFFPAAS